VSSKLGPGSMSSTSCQQINDKVLKKQNCWVSSKLGPGSVSSTSCQQITDEVMKKTSVRDPDPHVFGPPGSLHFSHKCDERT
jgi:hypothetical protein